MLITTEDDLYNVVRYAPIGICILDAATLSAEMVNDKFLEVAGKPYDAIYGKWYWEPFAEAKPYYEDALNGVVKTGEAYYADEVELMLIRHGRKEWVFVTFVYSPIKNGDDQVTKVAVWVLENTSGVKQRQQLQTLNEQLATTNKELSSANKQQNELVTELQAAKKALHLERDRLSRFFMQVPAGICVLEGPKHTYELVNPEYQKLFPGRHLVGLPVVEALPELKGTPIEETLDRVYTTGEIYEANSLMVPLARTADGPVENRYFNFIYQARLTADNQVDGILVLVFEVTEQANAHRRIEELNRLLSDTNQELAAMNKDLQASNKEFDTAQQQLQNKNAELMQSRERFRNMIQSSPVAMLITRGDQMIFEEINEAMLRMIDKDESVKGKPWFEAIPELVGQPIIEDLYHTYHTGEEQKLTHVPVSFIIDGKPYHGYYNISYTALIEGDKITGVMQSVVDVTGYITAKNELAKAYEQVRLSKEAAELGTFDMNMENGHMEWDARCRQLFGISHQNNVDFEEDFLSRLHPDDSERVRAVLDRTFSKSLSNGIYDVEYRTIGVEDGQLRWVRAKGQVYFNPDDTPLRFIGSVLDITEQKQDELRKNDFIAMVSHELKTPLTSLNAHLQMLHSKAQNSGDTFTAGSLQQANKQVKKMTTMINGFLNVSRLESGKMHIDKRRFDMADLLKEVREETLATITSHQILFAPVIATNVMADPDKIGQVINNFVSNAVKYSPGGSTINVTCVTLNGHVQVSVQDEGFGIKPEDQEKLFDRYYRVPGNAAYVAGFGIGLYLCAEIIEWHKGRIWVESKVGKGSTFYFSLSLD